MIPSHAVTARFGRWTLPALTLLLLALAGCGKGGAGGGMGFKPPPMPVETAPVAQGRVADRFEAVGSIEASEAITVVSEIDGTVVRLPFQEGTTVGRGGVIAQLDDAQLRAEVNRTEALRDQAQSTFNRVKSVVDQGAGAPQDLDDAAASLKVAQANLALAKSRLSKTHIQAPFSGALGARRVSPGAFIRAGQAITDLAKLDELRVNFSAPERYLGQLHRGAEVQIATTAYPGYALRGRIDVVDPVLDPSTRSARIVARVRNPGGKFRPGMSANVSAVLSQRLNALTIPSEAIFAEGDQSFAYVVKTDSTVTRAALTLGTRLSDAVEVVKGLAPGQTVVRTGHQKLFEGAKVIPVTSHPAGA
ncbi:MAG TPA: efflux RND transporter periplasmic adaptor subunit [Candidatus Saccharimonadales bacterium]|nr:efflux RND transporter periplasmic adaptor subunit [Candidatus Saccharimonadales bacterium]